jgi:hypothetical protein
MIVIAALSLSGLNLLYLLLLLVAAGLTIAALVLSQGKNLLAWALACVIVVLLLTLL